MARRKNTRRFDPRYFMDEKAEKTISEAGKPLPPDPGPYQHDPEAPFEMDPAGGWEEYWADDEAPASEAPAPEASAALPAIATAAAEALQRGRPGEIEQLMKKMGAPLPGEKDNDALRAMLSAMAEAARKLRDHSEEESNWSGSMRDGL